MFQQTEKNHRLGYELAQASDLKANPDESENPAVAYPILLNHEMLFVVVSAIVFMATVLILLIFLPMRESWVLGVIMSVSCGLLGTIMSDNLVLQIKGIFGETLKERINRNHLVKILKLSRIREAEFDFLLSVSYIVAGMLIFAVVYAHHPLTVDIKAIIERLAGLWMFFGLEFQHEMAWMLFLPIAYFFLTMLAVVLWLLTKRVLPDRAYSILFFPLIYLFRIIAAFHEVFKSLVKIVFFIAISWREFALSVFYLLISGIIALGRKHFISNIEVDLMLYVKSVILTIGALGYLFCILRAYS